MFHFVKKTGALIGLFVLAAFLIGVNAQLGMAFAGAVALISGFSIFKPLPDLGLSGRFFNSLVFLFVGVIGFAAASGQSSDVERAEIAALRDTDPTAYLVQMRTIDEDQWYEELAVLDPDAFAVEQERRAVELAEQEAAARVAEAAAAEERAQRSREQFERSSADVRALVEQQNWPQATTRFRAMDGAGYDMEEFRAEIEERALALVRPLPASDLEGNMAGYRFLAAVRADNSTYAERAQQYEDRIERQRRAVLDRLRRSEDRVAGVTFFHHQNAPRHLNSRSTVSLYIGTRNNDRRPWLRMRVQYAASNWLFVERVIAWHNGISEPLVTGQFERDNHSSIWEWIDRTPTELQLEILRSLSTASEAILRFEGRQYRRDVTLSEGDKRALREVLQAFEVMQEDARR